MALKLRDYQQECKDAIDALEGGAHLVHMATGLGKTVVFTSIERRGKVLILSHRDELVRQPLKFYDIPVGIEKAGETSHGEAVVSATVQTLARGKRLAKFAAGEFDTIITDEAHHALAPSYRKIIDTLQPRLHVGFTATPRRGDDRGLEDVFEDIIFSRDLRWGIEQGWLADIDCRRVYISWDTRRLHRKNGDYALAELDAEVNRPQANEQIVAAYHELAAGPTLVFAASVNHAHQLAAMIKGSAVVDGKMSLSERRGIVEAFASGALRCLINYGVFTEGTDLPMIRTVLLARPTQNPTLYAQMVGRGLRLDQEHGKRSVRLIDCVGITEDHRLCTAPTLFGLNEKDFPQNAGRVLDGSLLGLERRLRELEDTPEGWVLRIRKVDLLHEDLAWVVMFDGERRISGTDFMVAKSVADDLGGVDVRFVGNQTSLRHFRSESDADKAVRRWLEANPLTRNERQIWSADEVGRWAEDPASPKQLSYIRRLCGDEVLETLPQPLSKRDAAAIIENASAKQSARDAERFGRCPVCGAPLHLSKSQKMVVCSQLRWEREGDKLVPRGRCRFRFVRRYRSWVLTDDEVKRVVTTGSVVRGRTALTLKERADASGAYELAELGRGPARR